MLVSYVNSPVGILKIVVEDAAIRTIQFVEKSGEDHSSNNVLDTAKQQLEAYFDGRRKSFDLPLAPKGTSFQQKVWNELKKVPYGKTVSYQEIANRLGDPKVIRAAASANGKNPIAIVIPCHRIIGSDGSLTGYAGGLHRKKWLLEHESPVTQGELFD
ncbi:methylated-DNA--[protein]-cysteine S-methyltransferase [Flavobacteriaceae bacterium TK19130]|nr:methylated-DNA--[protein]-cysteine S-methyltransferase [Thermobacterium salinum]